MKFNITPVTVMLSAYDGDQRAGERVVSFLIRAELMSDSDRNPLIGQ